MEEKLEIFVNDTSHTFQEPITLKLLLEGLKLGAPHIAIVLNNEIIPLSLASEKKLKNGDRVELLSPTSGG